MRLLYRLMLGSSSSSSSSDSSSSSSDVGLGKSGMPDLLLWPIRSSSSTSSSSSCSSNSSVDIKFVEVKSKNDHLSHKQKVLHRLTHSLTHSINHSLHYNSLQSLTHSLAHSLTHSLTASPQLPLLQVWLHSLSTHFNVAILRVTDKEQREEVSE